MPESYTFEKQTIDVIESLRPVFGVSSNEEVISRALALAQVIGDQADERHMVIVAGKAGPIKVDLTQ